MSTTRGSCLCGSYRFVIEGPIQFLKNCHCSRCRKMSGSSFATYARARTEDLRVLSGADALTTYERCPGNVIAFCQHCGSLVPWPPAGSELLEFGAGLLDDDPGVKVAYHIYVGSRAPWCELQDGLLRFDEMGELPAPKPAHLGSEFGEQFADESIVRAYSARPPYPPELISQLAALVSGPSGHVLELGCGSGDVSFGLAALVPQLDAVDPSEAMLASARARAATPHNLHFIHSSAEAFTPSKCYQLAVAAESLHWMNWDHVLSKLARCLDQSAVLAIVTRRNLLGLPWSEALAHVIARHSTNREYKAYDVVDELTARGLFREQGRRTLSAPFSQHVDAYVESFHSRNGFSRERMDVGEAAAFDHAVRALVLEHCPDGIIASQVEATVVWGTPAPARS